ncbi:MAG: hypothetical protein OXL41_08765 [Nitrospinae bacterium]|nr:hypothetical protein [Nitrospinota bacterium]
MRYMNASPKSRKPNRLKGYDYTQAGCYFVTVCAQDRRCLFGDIIEDQMVLNEAGMMVAHWWSKTESKFPHVDLGEYVLMPNHIHGIVVIVGADPRVRPHDKDPESSKDERIEQRQQEEHQQDGFQNQGGHMGPPLQEIIQWFKTMTTNEYIKEVKTGRFPPFEKRIWQRSFYDHVIRDDDDLGRIREYIQNNPLQWAIDEENPAYRVVP